MNFDIIFIILPMAAVIILLICLTIYLKNKFKIIYNKNIYLNNKIKDKEDKILDLEDDLDNKIDSLKDKEKEINNLNDKLDKINQILEDRNSAIENYKSKSEEEKQYISNLLEILNAKKIVNNSLENYKELLNEFINLKEKYNFAFLTNIFFDLKYIENEIEMISANSFLYNKNVIAIGGGFSSGKSSFINTLFEIKDNGFLPVGHLPVTAIPSYIFDSKENKIECLTLDGRTAEISENLFKKMSQKSDINKTFNAKNIIKHFYVKNKLKYKNICFIDIPGYNPAKDSEEDIIIAREYINGVKVLILLLNICDGTISDSDLEFLKDILQNDNDKIIYIVCAYADLRDYDTIETVCNEIYKNLKEEKIKIEGISPYTSQYNKLDNNLEYSKLFKYGIPLNEFFDKMNKNTSYKVQELNNKIENIFEDNIKLGKDDIKNINTHIKFLRKIKLQYISDISERDGLIYRYKSIYKDINTTDFKNDNIEEFEKYINNHISNLEKNKEYIEECILFSNKIKIKILECINNIFNNEEYL